MQDLILFLADLALTVYCIADALQHPDKSPHGLPKIAWVLLFLLFPLVPEVVWLYLKFRSGAQERLNAGTPRGPDDDPDYLRWLRDQERRRKTDGR